MRLILSLLALLALAGCADPARNLYEGIKAGNDAKRSPQERAATPAPSYDEYQRERSGKAQ